MLKLVDSVIVPSYFNQNIFKLNDINAEVIPYPLVNNNSLTKSVPREINKISDETFVFLSIDTWQARKNNLGIVTSFLMSKHKNAKLIIKTNGSQKSIESEIYRYKKILNINDDPEIIVITRDLTESEILGLYDRADCFVSLSRGEAYGLSIMDVAQYGKPIIACPYGGHVERLIDYAGIYWVNGRMAPVIQDYHLFSADMQWYDADLLHAAELMNKVVYAGRYQVYKREFPELAPEVIGKKLLEVLSHGY